MLQAAVLGGLFSGIVGSLPFIGLGNCCCCLWYLCGGGIAAYLEQQNVGTTTNAGRGAVAGAAAGVIAAVVGLFMGMVMSALVGSPDAAIGNLLESSAEIPPEVRDALQAFASSGPAVFLAISFAFSLVAGTAFSAIGGALSAMFFRNDVPPALGGPPSLP